MACPGEIVTWATACFCGGAGALSGWCMFLKPPFNCQFPVKACFFSSRSKALACLPLFGWLNIKASTTYSGKLSAGERLFKSDAPPNVSADSLRDRGDRHLLKVCPSDRVPDETPAFSLVCLAQSESCPMIHGRLNTEQWFGGEFRIEGGDCGYSEKFPCSCWL